MVSITYPPAMAGQLTQRMLFPVLLPFLTDSGALHTHIRRLSRSVRGAGIFVDIPADIVLLSDGADDASVGVQHLVAGLVVGQKAFEMLYRVVSILLSICCPIVARTASERRLHGRHWALDLSGLLDQLRGVGGHGRGGCGSQCRRSHPAGLS